MRGGFRFFCASVGTIWIFKVCSQEVKTERKLNCNRALRRCRLNSRSAMYICNAPPGRKKDFRCALLVNFRSATHICKNSNCTFVSGTPEVHWTSRAEFLQASSLIGPILNPDYFIGYISSSFPDFSAPLVCPVAVKFPPCFYFLWINFKNSCCSNIGTEKS